MFLSIWEKSLPVSLQLFLKNITYVDKIFGLLMQKFVETEGLIFQPRRTLFSCFELKHRTVLTPLKFFCLEQGLVSTKKYRSVKCTPAKGFHGFVQSAVDGKWMENHFGCCCRNNETSCHANSFKGYKSMDRSHQSVTKYLKNKKCTQQSTKKVSRD